MKNRSTVILGDIADEVEKTKKMPFSCTLGPFHAKYEGEISHSSKKMRLGVEFDAKVSCSSAQEHIKTKVHVKGFKAHFEDDEYNIRALTKENGREALSTILGCDQTDLKVSRKMDLWGGREGAQRCYILEDKCYFNTGTSRITLTEDQSGVTTLHEAGLFTKEGVETKYSAVLASSVQCLMNGLHRCIPKGFESDNVIYTISKDNVDTKEALLSAGFKEAPQELGEALIKSCHNKRFTNEHGTFKEHSDSGYVEKDLLVADYDHLPEGMYLSGISEVTVDEGWC